MQISQFTKTAAAVAACSLFWGCGTAANDQPATGANAKAPDAKPATSAKMVRSLEELDQAKTFEDLAAFGLTAPEQRNHKSGTNLILLAFQAGVVFKGDWFKAIGLLGTQMIDVDLDTRIAYKSVFETGWGQKLDDITDPSAGSKVHLLFGASAFPGLRVEIPEHRSVIARRETALFGITTMLDRRYRYGSAGGYARHYGQQTGHSANAGMSVVVKYALGVYDELKGAGFPDETLKGAIGIATASLLHDGVTLDQFRVIESIGQTVRYSDALRATFERIREIERQDASTDFMPELCGRLRERDLLPHMDALLLPPNAEAHQALLKILATDLAANRQASKEAK